MSAFATTQARVLVLGAGGLGCELVKGLALYSVAWIDLVDMDVVELSNLNRQCMYRQQDLGRPKVDAAVEWVARRWPRYAGRMRGLHRRVEELPEAFYASYHVILSGLDSLEARLWINGLVVGTGAVLVDGGSEGYKGHVAVVVPGVTACLACLKDLFASPRLPMCTLASMPRTPAHCIQWAAMRHGAEDLRLIAEAARAHAGKHGIAAAGIDEGSARSTLETSVPGLSTTNSIVAALCVSEAMRLLAGREYTSETPNYQLYNGEDGLYHERVHIGRDSNCACCDKSC